MHPQRIAITLAAAAGMLGTFLPWANVPFMGSISGTGGDGWITLGLFLFCLIITVIGSVDRPLAGGKLALALVSAGIAGALGLYKIIDFESATGRSSLEGTLAQSFSEVISIGIGLYVIVGAALGVLLLAILLKKK